LREAVDGSLKRLRVDHIDLYQLHIPDPIVAFEASLGTLIEMQQQGKIRLIGLSNVTQEHIERARKLVPIVSVQNRYSFVDREWDYIVDYCTKNGIVFIPWFPLAAGRAALEAVARIAQAHSATSMQVALAWLLRRSPEILPIPGTSSLVHLEENANAMSLQLSQEEFEELAETEQVTFSR
jgi:aryl-alcohol dehydrogenase-like predicted oxidoreductase